MDDRLRDDSLTIYLIRNPCFYVSNRIRFYVEFKFLLRIAISRGFKC